MSIRAEDLVLFVVAVPGLASFGLGLIWLLGYHPGEKFVARLTAIVYSLLSVAVTWLFVTMRGLGLESVAVRLGVWFRVDKYEFPLSFFVDRLSLPLIALTVVLVGLVGSFSVRYLHRDRGYFRFFFLMNLFAFGSLLVFSSGSFDLLIGGWELVGLTSVLLIAFFQERTAPVRNAVWVFASYRLADVGLLLGVFLLHHLMGSASCQALFRGEWPGQVSAISASSATIIGLLLLVAASGKSAQGPFSGWLPRAMEGPTPSSAIFYGAISVHAGAYLLLRTEPLWRQSDVVGGAIVITGLITALFATLSHRVCSDAKTSLAYASMTQLSIIFVEIGFGLSWLALIHIVGHAIVRTFQFLRAPSMLHDYHRVHSAAGGHVGKTGGHFEALVPATAQFWLYRLGLDRGHYDALITRLVTEPVLSFADWLGRAEPKFQRRSTGKPERPLANETAGGD